MIFSVPITPTTAILGIILLLLVLYLYLKLHPTPLPGIPYNPSSPSRLLGDIPFLKSKARSTLDLSPVVFSLAKDLGTPIAQILFTSFSKPWVIIDDPREVEDILVRRNREFDRSELTASFFRPMLPRSTIAQFTTPELKSQKRLWADVMGEGFLKRVVAAGILHAGRELVELWRIKAGQGQREEEDYGEMGRNKKSFNPAYDFECTALDAIWVAVLGSKIGVLRNEINKVRMSLSSDKLRNKEVAANEEGLSSAATIQKAMGYMNKIVRDGNQSLIPALSTLRLQFSPLYRRFMKVAYSEVQSLMRKSCERFERINNNNNNTPSSGQEQQDEKQAGEELDTCAMDLVLRREILNSRKSGNTKTKRSDPTTDPAMLQELLLLLLGGHDSTTNTLCWFAKFAAMFPASQTRLRESLYDALGFQFQGHDGKGGEKNVEQLTAAKLMETDIPYLDAYVQELVRHSTTAGIITRTALVDTVVLGCHIPKGTHLLLNTRVDSTHVPEGKVKSGNRESGGRSANVTEALRSATSQSAQAKRTRGGLSGGSGKDLDIFNPSRWLVKSGITGKEVFDGHALPSLGFGGGLRGCFGKRLALMELRIMVAVLVLAFEFLPIEDETRNSMDAEERIFRRPKYCQVRLRVL